MADGYIMRDDVQEAEDVGKTLALHEIRRRSDGSIQLRFYGGAIIELRAEGVILLEVIDRGDR